MSNKNSQRKVSTTNFIGIPDERHVKLRYRVSVSSTTSAYGEVIIRGNGCYDPEHAVGGDQPMWYDQYAAMYRRYQCYKATISVETTQRTAATEAAFIVTGIYPLSESSTTTNLDTAIERQRSVHKTMGPNTGGPNVVTNKLTATTREIYGIPEMLAKYEDGYSSTIASLPYREWYFHVFFGTQDGVTSANIYLNIVVDYTVRFFQVDDVSSSFYLCPRIDYEQILEARQLAEEEDELYSQQDFEAFMHFKSLIQSNTSDCE